MLSNLVRKSANRYFFSHSLDQASMKARSSLFYSSNQDYHPDTIKYDFNLTLNPGDAYKGVAQIAFRLQHANNDLFLDFAGKSISQLIVNGQQIAHQHQNGRITLHRDVLKAGDNQVCVDYENVYDKDGSGCVSFTDVDGKQYLYTQFEPFMGNRVFPMFDQPDLKAKMTLSISCSSSWEAVLSNQFPSSSPRTHSACALTQKVLQKHYAVPEGYKTTTFGETKLLPTYLYCFVVGPYKKYACATTYKNIPMNLYCIESLYPYMVKQAPFIEQMTCKSMEFFESYFGYPYPFSKYDQVFAHEYKWGAMENAGIVTLNDLYIFKDPVSTERMLGFGNTIVHELAHHWFGNLVTMRWWDDLWLNESFAEYISHFCLQKIKPQVSTINYESAMASFLSRKAWGYSEDQLITTHPIRSQVKDTHVAESIFDGITYSKGAATMKQLMYLMGEESFSKSLSSYFHKYAFKNARLQDLLEELKKNYKSSSPISIDEWKNSWLETAGLNVLHHELLEESSTLRIHQSAYHQNHATLRPHTIKVAAIDSEYKVSVLQVQVNPSSVTDIKLSPSQFDLLKKSKAVVLNHEDLSFVKVAMDTKSQHFLKSNLKNIKDDILLRSLIWKSFFEMARDAKMKTTDYLQVVLNNAFNESSDVLFEQSLSNLHLLLHKYMGSGTLKESAQDRIFNRLLEEIGNKHEANRTVILKDKLIQLGRMSNPKHIQALKSWNLEEPSSQLLKSLKAPTITEKWKLTIKLLESEHLSISDKQGLLDKQIKLDNSDVMKNKKITCDTILIADLPELEKVFDRYLNDSSWSMTTYNHSMMGFNNAAHKTQLRNTFREKYFQVLSDMLAGESGRQKFAALKSTEMVQLFLTHMDPQVEDSVGDLEWKLEKFSKLKVVGNEKLRVELLKKVDNLKRRIKCYKLNETQ